MFHRFRAEDPAFAAERHVSEALERHPVSQPVSLQNMIMSRNLRERIRLLNMDAAEAHRLREPKAAAALEVAEEAVAEARLFLEGRKA